MMSGPNSGTSTPRGSVTPTPSDGNAGSASGNAAAAPTAASSPNPLTVGTHFVKQYYKVLSTTPDQIFRFYQSSSVLSQGVGSQLPTPPSTLEASGMDAVKDRFVLPGFEGCPIRFEFEHGAIDAQLSMNGGVLLVVTGHLVYVDSAVDNGNSSSNSNHRHRNCEDTRKAFVHTFFLGSTTAGSKRSYYVHNDILRFLHDANDVEESTVVASNISPKASSKKVAQPDDAIIDGTDPAAALAAAPLPLAVETNHVTLEPPSTTLQKLSLEEGPGDDAPGGGVEESKDVAVDEGAAAPAVAVEQFASSEKETQWSSGAATPVAKEDEPKAAAAARPTPGSWASLVASGSNSTPATPTRASAITPVRAAPSSASTKPVPSSPAVKVVAAPTPPSGAAPPASATTAAAGTAPAPDAPRPPAKFVKRDPDCTLVIKNIDSDTTEADVLAVFESFAASADAKVVSLTVSGHKGIAFVDYDSSAPVLAAVARHGKEPFQMNGRELDVYQKTLEKMNRKASGRGGGGGGGFRGGGAPGNGSAGRGGDRGSGPGGRKPYGRGGRGDRDRGGERGGRGGR